MRSGEASSIRPAALCPGLRAIPDRSRAASASSDGASSAETNARPARRPISTWLRMRRSTSSAWAVVIMRPRLPSPRTSWPDRSSVATRLSTVSIVTGSPVSSAAFRMSVRRNAASRCSRWRSADATACAAATAGASMPAIERGRYGSEDASPSRSPSRSNSARPRSATAPAALASRSQGEGGAAVRAVASATLAGRSSPASAALARHASTSVIRSPAGSFLGRVISVAASNAAGDRVVISATLARICCRLVEKAISALRVKLAASKLPCFERSPTS